MSEEMKTFTLGQVLSCTTRVLCADLYDVYDMVEHLYGYDAGYLYGDDVPEYLLQQFPQLEQITDDMVVGKDCAAKVAELTKKYGNEFPLQYGVLEQ